MAGGCSIFLPFSYLTSPRHPPQSSIVQSLSSQQHPACTAVPVYAVTQQVTEESLSFFLSRRSLVSITLESGGAAELSQRELCSFVMLSVRSSRPLVIVMHTLAFAQDEPQPTRHWSSLAEVIKVTLRALRRHGKV